MKKIFLFSLLMSFIGCYGDKGDYNYTDINEVTISGIKKQYTLNKGIDKIVIHPEIVSTMEKDGSESYSYSWSIGGGILSTEKNLDCKIDSAKGTYRLYFKVRDNKTNLVWKTYTDINLVSAINKGFNVLGEDKNGYMQLDMLAFPPSADTLVLSDLIVGDSKIKGASRVIHTGGYYRDDIIKMWTIGGDNANFIDLETQELNPSNSIHSLFYTTLPIPSDLRAVDVGPRSIKGVVGRNGSNRYILSNNGWMFTATSMIAEGEVYGDPVNFIPTESQDRFKTAPYIMYAPVSASAFILYDTDNERFVRGSNSGKNMFVLADKDIDVFPWKQNGRTLKYAENTRDTDGGAPNGNTFAIMKSADNQSYWIYKFYVTSSPIKRDCYEIKNGIAQDFGNTMLYAFSSKRTAVFYAVGSTLYAYDYNKGLEARYTIDFGNVSNDEITMIKFDAQSDDLFNDLYVATYNSTTGGTLRKVVLNVANTNAIEVIKDPKNVWSGFCKIKDIDYRND